LYREQGQFAKALDDLTRAIDLDSAMTSQALVSRGFTYRLMGRSQHPQALQDFNRAIELYAQDSWAIAQRGYLYMVEDNYSQALKDFNRALEINPEFTWALLSRGETYRLMRQKDEALKTINQALAIEPENGIALANRSYLYFFDLFNQKAAERDIEQVLAQNPEDSDMLALRGALALFYGDYARALASFERAIALNPEDAIALTNRGEIFLIRKQYEAAQASFNQALKLDATDTWTQYLQALTLYAQGKSAQADRLVPDLLAQVTLEYADEPGDWRAVINLAILNLLAKQPERAGQLYRKAAASAPPDLLQEGYHDLNTFLSVFPKHPQALAMQALLRPRLSKK
jgi:tetratricopeptide (TPR) repeat protein